MDPSFDMRRITTELDDVSGVVVISETSADSGMHAHARAFGIMRAAEPDTTTSTTSDALDWTGYHGTVVGNVALAGGTTLLSHADGDEIATTVDELADMSLVQILASILYLRKLTANPTRFKLTTLPSIAWSSSLAAADISLEAFPVSTASVVNISVAVPGVTVSRGVWSNNTDESRDADLRLFVKSAGGSYSALTSSAPSHVIKTEAVVSPLAHDTTHVFKFAQADMHGVLYAAATSAKSTALHGVTARLVVDEGRVYMVLPSVESSTAAVTTLVYYNQDEPAPTEADDGYVILDEEVDVFRRRYKWPQVDGASGEWKADDDVAQSLDFSEAIGVDVDMGDASTFRVSLASSTAAARYVPVGTTAVSTVSTDSSYYYENSVRGATAHRVVLLNTAVFDLGIEIDEMAVSHTATGSGLHHKPLRRLAFVDGVDVTTKETTADDVTPGLVTLGVSADDELSAKVDHRVGTVAVSDTVDTAETRTKKVVFSRSYNSLSLTYQRNSTGVPSANVIVDGLVHYVIEPSLGFVSKALMDLGTSVHGTDTIDSVTHAGSTWERSFTLGYTSTSVVPSVSVADGIGDGTRFIHMWREAGSGDARRFYVDRRRYTAMRAPNSAARMTLVDRLSAGVVAFSAEQTLVSKQTISIYTGTAVDADKRSKIRLSGSEYDDDNDDRDTLERHDTDTSTMSFPSYDPSTAMTFSGATSFSPAASFPTAFSDFNDTDRAADVASFVTAEYDTYEPRDTDRIARSECLRMGMVFVMGDGTTETYSYPIDQSVARAGVAGFDDYAPHEIMGVKSDSTGAGRTYNAFAAPSIAKANVQDTGDGLLDNGGTSNYGIVFKTSFLHDVVLHLDNFVAYVPTTLNGTAYSDITWSIYTGVLFHLTFPSMGIIITITYEGVTKTAYTLSDGDSLTVISQYTSSTDSFSHTLTHMSASSTTLMFELSGGSQFDILIRSADGTAAHGRNMKCQAIVLEFGSFSTTSDAAAFNKVAAIGARKASRRYLRETMKSTAAIMAETDDLDPVSHVFEYFEWPQRGPAMFGFAANHEYGSSGDTTDDGGDITARWPTIVVKTGVEDSEYDLFVLQKRQDKRYVTRSRVDGYNRYTFGNMTFASNGRATVSTHYPSNVRLKHGGTARDDILESYMSTTSPLLETSMTDMSSTDTDGYTKWAAAEFK
jgi:hypothetical protein